MPPPAVGTGRERWQLFSAAFLGFLANFAMVYAISSAKTGEKADGFSVLPGRRSLLTAKEERDSGKRGEIGQKSARWRGRLRGTARPFRRLSRAGGSGLAWRVPAVYWRA